MKRIFAALLPLLLLCGCAAKEYSTDFFAMDTFMSVKVLGKESEALAQDCERRINELERELSRTREESGVWLLNHANGKAVPITDREADVLAAALAISGQTGGLYDPTVAPLTDLWGVGTEYAHVPEQREIANALLQVGASKLHLSADGRQVQADGGAQLDLGGIAKGYAADECAAILRAADTSGLLTLGGNIYAVGTNHGEPWVIGIADPDESTDYIATVAVQDKSVVTSGDYERYFEQDGKRYHHIFDPRTGYPADNGLRSVTVIDENSTRADALTTALFVMGLDEGMAFCEQNGIAAVFVTADKQVITTPDVPNVCTFFFAGAEKGYTDAQ
ncbi:MAG: FAD:protein FMN transferase [Eubacteriales bacterium]|nr:FAD:protein FMN transferase [Eubacteriales bacterium]